VKQKKADERMKSVSEGGKEKYIEMVEGFIEDLNELEKANLERFSKDIDKLFEDFNKSSHMSYERATILIGKEMARVKEIIVNLFRDLRKIFEVNKNLIDSLKAFSFIELRLEEITKVDTELGKIKKSFVSLDKDLVEAEEENKKILDEIEEIKKSEDYVKNLGKQNKVSLLKEELEKDILSLRQVIDFKALASFYHIFEDKMELVKGFRDDFQKRFRDDGEAVLNSLLEDAKLNNENISSKIEKIKGKEEETTKLEQEIKPDETQQLYNQTTGIVLDIGNLKNEKIRQEKRGENLKSVREELIKKVKDKMEEIGVEFV
jgi:hypothetical protein